MLPLQPRTVALTGATGFLGSWLCRELLDQGHTVRALILPGDSALALAELPIERVTGNITNPSDVDALLQGLGPNDVVIHAASVVSVAWQVYPELATVNVGGAANVVDAVRRHAIGRLVYVSSVQALPEPPPGTTSVEADRMNPGKVIGGYAQTKAEATELVLAAGRSGLDVVVVQPSALLGPGDPGPSAQTRLMMDLVAERRNTGVDGGQDFVDVRDVAVGIVAAMAKGRSGECYLLSGRYMSMSEMLERICAVAGRRPVTRIVPTRWLLPFAVAVEPLFAARRRWPSLARYSLHTLGSRARYSHEKATAELGYQPRDPLLALDDAVAFLRAGGFAGRTVGAVLRSRANQGALGR